MNTLKIRCLITGGTGTVGSAFVERYRERYDCWVLGHSEKRLREFSDRFPDVPVRLCDIEDPGSMVAAVRWANPDAVIHAAAIKHVDYAEQWPIRASRVNVQGSVNVLAACCQHGTPIAVMISTDKAASPHSTYGYTKALAERCFLEDDRAVCRFGNVAGSAGSVIPRWIEQQQREEPLAVTSSAMARFFFTVTEAVELIDHAIQMCLQGDSQFVLTKQIKAVRILDLAHAISDKVNIVGCRSGERLGETLYSADEAGGAIAYDNGEVRIGCRSTLAGREYSTQTAPYMTMDEIKTLVSQAQTLTPTTPTVPRPLHPVLPDPLPVGRESHS